MTTPKVRNFRLNLQSQDLAFAKLQVGGGSFARTHFDIGVLRKCTAVEKRGLGHFCCHTPVKRHAPRHAPSDCIGKCGFQKRFKTGFFELCDLGCCAVEQPVVVGQSRETTGTTGEELYPIGGRLRQCGRRAMGAQSKNERKYTSFYSAHKYDFTPYFLNIN